MKAGCAHLLNGDYFYIVYWYLAIDRFRTLQHEFSYRLVKLKEAIPFYIEGKANWYRDKLRMCVKTFDRKLDDTSVADLWKQIELMPRAEKSSKGTKLKRGKRKREH